MTIIIAGCKTRPAITHSTHSNEALSEEASWPVSFGLGRTPTVHEIASLDIDINPDGKGLPEGEGNIVSGKIIYANKCASCHGKTGIEGPFNKLVTNEPGDFKEKTIGNYWPYATTVFDYVRRSMPFNAPGSLTNEEVYGLTAFLLYSNKIIDSTTIINKETLPKVVMPARKRFVTDDRRGGPEVR